MSTLDKMDLLADSAETEETKDHQMLCSIEKNILMAYQDRQSKKPRLFQRHPLGELNEFLSLLQVSPLHLEKRVRQCAEQKVHLPVLAWVGDPNGRIHHFALGVLSKMTDGIGENHWSETVCKDVFTLGALPLVIEHCRADSSSPEVTKFAAIILKNMAEYSDACSRLIVKSDACQAAVDVAKMPQQGSEETATKCVQMLAVLSNLGENRADMCFANEFLPSLVQCGDIKISSIQLAVFTVMANLALEPYMKQKMVRQQGSTKSVLQKMVAKLTEPWSDEILTELVRIIANITVDSTTHDRLHEVDALGGQKQEDLFQRLMDAMALVLSNTQNAKLRLQLCRLFCNLTLSDKLKKNMLTILGVLLRLLRDVDNKDKNVHYWAAATLARMASNVDLHPRIMQQKGLRPLVTFATLQNSKDDTDVRTRHYAVLTLARLAMSDDNREDIIQEGGLVPLLVWARGFKNNEIEHASKAALTKLGVDLNLMEFEEDDSDESEVTTELGAKQFVTLAKSAVQPAVQAYAAEEIANLALNYESLKNVIRSNALPKIIELASNSNEDVQKAAHRALLNLSRNDDGMDLAELRMRKERRKLEMERGKVKKRRQMDPELHAIEQDEIAKRTKIQHYCDCLGPVLLRYLVSGPTSVKILVAMTIANLTILREIQELLVKLEAPGKAGEQRDGEGGIFTLIQVLSSSNIAALRIHCARALFNLTVNPECAEWIFQRRGVNVCINNFNHQDNQIARLSIGVVAQLASYPQYREQGSLSLKDPKLKLVYRLVDLGYSCSHAIVQEQVSRCLAMLGLDDDFRGQIVQEHGAELLIRWAGSSRTSVQIQAAMALVNLSEDWQNNNAAIRQHVIKQGLFQVMWTLAQVGHPLSQLQVVRLLRQLRQINTLRPEEWKENFKFMAQGGITPLLHLARYPPEGEHFLQVRGDAAHELCGWINAGIAIPSVAVDMKSLIGEACPVIVKLLIEHDEEGMQQSTGDMREGVLRVCDRLLHQAEYKDATVNLLATPGTREALYALYREVYTQKITERRAEKRKRAGKPPEEHIGLGEAPEPVAKISEEARTYVENAIEMLRLAEKITDLDDRYAADFSDFQKPQKEDSLDLAVKQMKGQLEQAEGDAQEDKNNVSAGLDGLQDKLMELEVEKLQSSSGGKPKKVFKVVVVGDVSVGKSSVIFRYCNGKAPPEQMAPTMGVEYRVKLVERSDVTVLLQLFDIQGHERYRKNAPRSFFKDAHGAAVCFDSHKDQDGTFYHQKEWKKTVDDFFADNERPNAPCILLANKSDIPNEMKGANVRQASRMADCVRDHGYTSWHAVSAKEGTGLSAGSNNAFDRLIDEMLEWDAEKKYAKEGDEDIVDLEEVSDASWFSKCGC